MAYETLADEATIETTVKNLQINGMTPRVFDTGKEALEEIQKMIPAGASVMNGSSKTLEQIGFIDFLKSENHGWKNLHEEILKETDPEKQALLRKTSVLSDFYLGSVHALTEEGEMIIASNTGSQLPHIVFTSTNLIFVVSSKKITKDLSEGMKRLEETVFPLENERITKIYGSGTQISKIVIFKKENLHMGRKVHVFIIKEDFGF